MDIFGDCIEDNLAARVLLDIFVQQKVNLAISDVWDMVRDEKYTALEVYQILNN